ncbi:MAG: IS4 family transposase [Armatimonadota bacterium]|nr:IS4 family transposase [Armatimonadota bacterium]
MKSSLSLFAQIVQVIRRARFARVVRRTSAERHSKGFSSWDQLIAMLFCQFAQSKSLREITDGLAVTCGKLNHLGLRSAPAKSTLAYANAHRPWQMFELLFGELLTICKSVSPGKKRKFRFKNRLLSLDASIIELCVTMFPWADFHHGKGAAKLHLLLDHGGYLPVFADLTEGNRNELKIAQSLRLPKGSIVALDRGYIDYGLFQRWTNEGVFFVTRLKDKSLIEVIKERLAPTGGNVLVDALVKMTGYLVKRKCASHLRIVVVWDERSGKHVTFLTNNFALAASTIAAIYRDRWEIELFFKVLKQHLKIKTFVGTSLNAVKIQIWTALITLLLIKFIQFKSKCAFALCRLVALLRLNLFTYRDLWDWLANPLAVPPLEPPPQLELSF